jgi:cell wall-associated NlpC family hydrolase
MNAPMMPDPIDQAAGDAFVNRWIGAPFAWDGRSPAGVDCWGLAWCWHRDVLGVQLPDWIKGKRGRGWIWRTLADERAGAAWHRLEAPEPGCIVLTLPGARPAHVGIFWRGGILHAAEGVGTAWNPLALFSLAHPGHEFGRYQPGAPMPGASQ